MPRALSICFFGRGIGSAYHGTAIRGGSELQTALLARALSAQGMDVIIVDPDSDGSKQLGPTLKLQAVENWRRGVKGIRFFLYRLPGLYRTIIRTKMPVVYVRGFSFLYLIALVAAHRMKARFILAIASDTDLEGFRTRFSKSYKNRPSIWQWISTIIPNEIAFGIVLRKADLLFVQHEYQARLAGRFNSRIVRMNNIVDDMVLSIKPQERRDNIILVGGLSARKDLHLAIPILGELPELTFEFIGKPEDKDGEEIYTILSRQPNAILHGALDHCDTVKRIAGAKALLNTSRVEGFPNTFIEAWSVGTPVISYFVDPGGIIAANRLGYVCNGDSNLLKQLLRRSYEDLDNDRIRQYVIQHHSMKAVLTAFMTAVFSEPAKREIF